VSVSPAPWHVLFIGANWQATACILGCLLFLFAALRYYPWALVCLARALRTAK
jgi:hypothetical protein